MKPHARHDWGLARRREDREEMEGCLAAKANDTSVAVRQGFEPWVELLGPTTV